MSKLLLAVLAAKICLVPSSANENNSDVKSLCERLNYANSRLIGQFLYQQVQDHPHTTFATSALPALCILGEMGLHSQGFAFAEILNLLNLDNVVQIKRVLPYAIDVYTSNEDVISILEYIIYAGHNTSFREDIIEEFQDLVNGETGHVDTCNADDAAQTMNKWVKDHGQGHNIQDIISTCEIKEDDGLYVFGFHKFIVNWGHPFNPKGMEDIDFRTNGQVITMPALSGDGLLNYSDNEDLKCRMLELPLKDNVSSVLILLPNEEKGLLDVLKKIKEPEEFNKAYNSMEKHCINVRVPLGEVHDTVDVKKSLIKANYTLLFSTETADLKNISKGNNKNIYISQFRHAISLIGNAQVGTNESGTSSSSSDVCCGENDTPDMNCDHPFVYLVKRKSAILIGGGYFGNT